MAMPACKQSPIIRSLPLLRVKNQAEPLLVVEMSAAVCLTG